MNKFWMVWNCRGDRRPIAKHDSKTSARKEAERLAVENPADVFVVLESLGHYATRKPVQFTKHGIDQSTYEEKL